VPPSIRHLEGNGRTAGPLLVASGYDPAMPWPMGSTELAQADKTLANFAAIDELVACVRRFCCPRAASATLYLAGIISSP